MTERFGQGIICPFQRDAKNDFANAGGDDLLRADIGELLGIKGPSAKEPGELPWDPDRGSRLDTLRHRRLHTEMMRGMAEQYSAGPIRKYERRVRVGPVRIEREEKTLRIEVSYQPVGTQTGQLQTVPMYVTED